MCAACDAAHNRLAAAEALRDTLAGIDALAMASERRELKVLHPVPHTDNAELSEMFLKIVGAR